MKQAVAGTGDRSLQALLRGGSRNSGTLSPISLARRSLHHAKDSKRATTIPSRTAIARHPMSIASPRSGFASSRSGSRCRSRGSCSRWQLTDYEFGAGSYGFGLATNTELPTAVVAEPAPGDCGCCVRSARPDRCTPPCEAEPSCRIPRNRRATSHLDSLFDGTQRARLR